MQYFGRGVIERRPTALHRPISNAGEIRSGHEVLLIAGVNEQATILMLAPRMQQSGGEMNSFVRWGFRQACRIPLLESALRWAAGRLKGPARHGTAERAAQWLARSGIEIAGIVDVGASDGRWSQKVRRHFPDASIWMFEANPIHTEALYASAQEIGASATMKAIGGGVGMTGFDASDPFGGALVQDSVSRPGHITVPLSTLDEELDGVHGPLLLKLDTHGHEMAILSGAASVLDRCNALWIECYNFRIEPQAALFWEMCSFISGQGFTVADMVGPRWRPQDGAFWQVDILFVRPEEWSTSGITSYRY